MGLKYVKYFCPDANFIIKTDDDNYIDINGVIEILRRQQKLYPKLSPFDTQNNFQTPNSVHKPNLFDAPNISCFLVKGPYVKRSFRSKWRVGFKV